MKLFSEYASYLKNNPEGYWFKRKLYGFGWVPATKAGWTILGVYLLFVIGLSVNMNERVTDAQVLTHVLLPIAIATAVLLAVTVKTGEPLKWQWGKRHGER